MHFKRSLRSNRKSRVLYLDPRHITSATRAFDAKNTLYRLIKYSLSRKIHSITCDQRLSNNLRGFRQGDETKHKTATQGGYTAQCHVVTDPLRCRPNVCLENKSV